MGGINQIGRGSEVSFLFKMGSSRDIKELSLTLTSKSESLFAKILKSPIDTIQSQKSIWSFTAVDFLDFFPVEGETPECSPFLTIKYRHVSP